MKKLSQFLGRYSNHWAFPVYKSEPLPLEPTCSGKRRATSQLPELNIHHYKLCIRACAITQIIISPPPPMFSGRYIIERQQIVFVLFSENFVQKKCVQHKILSH
jgi:hypothetical protein